MYIRVCVCIHSCVDIHTCVCAYIRVRVYTYVRMFPQTGVENVRRHRTAMDLIRDVSPVCHASRSTRCATDDTIASERAQGNNIVSIGMLINKRASESANRDRLDQLEGGRIRVAGGQCFPRLRERVSGVIHTGTLCASLTDSVRAHRKVGFQQLPVDVHVFQAFLQCPLHGSLEGVLERIAFTVERAGTGYQRAQEFQVVGN
jgi:hypothetical protein